MLYNSARQPRPRLCGRGCCWCIWAQILCEFVGFMIVMAEWNGARGGDFLLAGGLDFKEICCTFAG